MLVPVKNIQRDNFFKFNYRMYLISCVDHCIKGWRVTLLESINKRCVFMEHVAGVTRLLNVQIVRGRAEVPMLGLLDLKLKLLRFFCYE